MKSEYEIEQMIELLEKESKRTSDYSCMNNRNARMKYQAQIDALNWVLDLDNNL
jgi:regulator of PEP synthase PpsR (kinase-PPPase family)